MADDKEEWPMPRVTSEEREALERHQDLVRAFQRDYKGKGVFKGLVGENTLRALLVANGKCLAKDLRKGYCFSYPGSFKIYEAQSDAVPDDRIEGKVVLPVTDHGLRDGMRTRLDAVLVCTLHERPVTWPWPKEQGSSGHCPKCGSTMLPGKVPGGPGLICGCGHYEAFASTKEKKEKES